MRMLSAGSFGIRMVSILFFFLAEASWAHVTLRPNQPLQPKGFGVVSLNVPNERNLDTTRVTLEIPDAFLKAGGRLSRVEYPPGWQVKLYKEDKPGDVYRKEMGERSKREGARAAGAELDAKRPKSDEDKQEQQALDELRKKWIKKVTFEGGSIPPDGFQVFSLNFELPDSPGEFRFPSVQTYADGKDVSWSELVQGAEHPAPTLSIRKPALISEANLPLPLAGLALLVSLATPFLRFRQRRKGHAVPLPTESVLGSVPVTSSAG